MGVGEIIAGIDPGVHTGLALWNCKEQKFIKIQTLTIIQAMHELEIRRHLLREIWFEDARMRTWFGTAGREKLQGAGSIKRDCSIWQEFCEYHEIPFRAIKPARGQTKWPAPYFQKVTGWGERTSQHARDAGALVFGVK